jgi:hypothetical protein
MKWISLVGLSVVTAAALSAATVTYSTSGVFSTTGTNMLAIDGGDLTFDGLTDNTVTVPSNLSYGTFVATGVTGTVPVSEDFTLTLTETSPVSGSADVTATLSGMINSTQSTIALLFTTTSFSIGGNEYTISQPDGGIPIVPQSTNSGVTLEGTVVPEPATYLGIGSGLALVGLALWRKVRG